MTSKSQISESDGLEFRTRLSSSYKNELRSSRSQRHEISKQSKHSAAIQALKTHVTQLEAEKRELDSKLKYLRYLLDTEVCKRKKLKIKTESMCQEIHSIKKVLSDHGISATLTRHSLKQFDGASLKREEFMIPPYRPSESLPVRGKTREKTLCETCRAVIQSPKTQKRKSDANSRVQSTAFKVNEGASTSKANSCFQSTGFKVNEGASTFKTCSNFPAASASCAIDVGDALRKVTEPDKFSKFNDWIDSSIASCPTFSPQVVLHRLDPKIFESFNQ